MAVAFGILGVGLIGVFFRNGMPKIHGLSAYPGFFVYVIIQTNAYLVCC